MKKIIAIALTIMLGCSMFAPTANAKEFLKCEDTVSKMFAIPEGGWSSINVNVSYYEYYTVNGNNAVFSERCQFYLENSAGATEPPYVRPGNVVHSNDKVFKNWSRQSIIYDANKWNSGNGWKNAETVTYNSQTSITGTLAFTLVCDGAVIPISAHTINMSLKTK